MKEINLKYFFFFNLLILIFFKCLSAKQLYYHSYYTQTQAAYEISEVDNPKLKNTQEYAAGVWFRFEQFKFPIRQETGSIEIMRISNNISNDDVINQGGGDLVIYLQEDWQYIFVCNDLDNSNTDNKQILYYTDMSDGQWLYFYMGTKIIFKKTIFFIYNSQTLQIQKYVQSNKNRIIDGTYVFSIAGKRFSLSSCQGTFYNPIIKFGDGSFEDYDISILDYWAFIQKPIIQFLIFNQQMITDSINTEDIDWSIKVEIDTEGYEYSIFGNLLIISGEGSILRILDENYDISILELLAREQNRYLVFRFLSRKREKDLPEYQEGVFDCPLSGSNIFFYFAYSYLLKKFVIYFSIQTYEDYYTIIKDVYQFTLFRPKLIIGKIKDTEQSGRFRNLNFNS